MAWAGSDSLPGEEFFRRVTFGGIRFFSPGRVISGVLWLAGFFVSLSRSFSAGDREPEMSPFSLLRFYPDLAPVALDDLTTDGQPDARALIRTPTMQTPEGFKDLLGILGLDADAVVFHPVDPVPILFFEGQPDDRALITAKLQRIRERAGDSLLVGQFHVFKGGREPYERLDLIRISFHPGSNGGR